MKLISWNVNGIRSCLNQGLEKFFKDENSDFFSIQEIKCNEKIFTPKGYKFFYNFSKKKGYSGIAVFTKYIPLSTYFDDDGRIISLEHDRFYLINVYIPNSKDGIIKRDYRSEWEDKFKKYLSSLVKPIILCGDFNSDYENENLNFLDENKDFLCNLIDEFHLIDAFRVFYSNEKIYTWKSIKNKNSGSRIDYFFISDYFSKNLEGSKIYSNIKGSDHFHIGVSLELPIL